jgi:hypothetical protein
MTKNRLLNIAVVICKIIKLMYIAAIILITATFIYIKTDNNYFEGKNVRFDTPINNASSMIPFNYAFTDKWKYNSSTNDHDIYNISNITTYSYCIIYLKFITMLILLYLCTKEFQNIIQSVKSFSTFKQNNVLSFKRIGKYLLIYFAITSYSVIYYNEGGISSLNFNFTTILCILISFIMAEIFKEGNKLQLENDLTV